MTEKVANNSRTMDVPFDFPIVVQKSYVQKTDSGEENWYIEGYAATSDFDLQGDIISQEALKKSEKQLLDNSTVLFNHNDNMPIGRVVESNLDANGLFIKALISKTAPDFWEKITEGVLNKFSISAKVIKAAKKFVKELGTIANVIDEMLLLEVSLVSVPANPQAKAMNWYIGKALRNFEKEGGVIEMSKDIKTQNAVAEAQLDEQVSKNLAEATAEDNVVTDENGNAVVEEVPAEEVTAEDVVTEEVAAEEVATPVADAEVVEKSGGPDAVMVTDSIAASGNGAEQAKTVPNVTGQPDLKPSAGIPQSNDSAPTPAASNQVGGNANINPSSPMAGTKVGKNLGYILTELEYMQAYLLSPDCDDAIPETVKQFVQQAVMAMYPADTAVEEAMELGKSAEVTTPVVAPELTKALGEIETLKTTVANLQKSMPVTRKGLIRTEEPGITKADAIRTEIQKGNSPEDRLKIALGHKLI